MRIHQWVWGSTQHYLLTWLAQFLCVWTTILWSWEVGCETLCCFPMMKYLQTTSLHSLTTVGNFIPCNSWRLLFLMWLRSICQSFEVSTSCFSTVLIELSWIKKCISCYGIIASSHGTDKGSIPWGKKEKKRKPKQTRKRVLEILEHVSPSPLMFTPYSWASSIWYCRSPFSFMLHHYP